MVRERNRPGLRSQIEFRCRRHRWDLFQRNGVCVTGFSMHEEQPGPVTEQILTCNNPVCLIVNYAEPIHLKTKQTGMAGANTFCLLLAGVAAGR